MVFPDADFFAEFFFSFFFQWFKYTISLPSGLQDFWWEIADNIIKDKYFFPIIFTSFSLSVFLELSLYICWLAWWCFISPLSSHDFSSFFVLSVLQIWSFQSFYYQGHWIFLLPAQTYSWTPLVNFSFSYCTFKLHNFGSDPFYNFHLVIDLLIFFIYNFLDFFSLFQKLFLIIVRCHKVGGNVLFVRPDGFFHPSRGS